MSLADQFDGTTNQRKLSEKQTKQKFKLWTPFTIEKIVSIFYTLNNLVLSKVNKAENICYKSRHYFSGVIFALFIENRKFVVVRSKD
jgi:hypothetical protein